MYQQGLVACEWRKSEYIRSISPVLAKLGNATKTGRIAGESSPIILD